jgi:N-acetylglucosamine-6-sulfatase
MGLSRLAPAVLGLAIALLAAAPNATARPASAARDGKPNILVVMTDDMAASDVRLMPNVRRLLAARGTTFADAVDSYPLCCPARATFITGQYAHNHDVRSNFFPHGWYGMKDRGNILPAWLQRAGYTTALSASGSTATAPATPTARSRAASTSGGASSTSPPTTTSTTS